MTLPNGSCMLNFCLALTFPSLAERFDALFCVLELCLDDIVRAQNLPRERRAWKAWRLSKHGVGKIAEADYREIPLIFIESKP